MDAAPEIAGTLDVFGSDKRTKLINRHVYGAWRFARVGLVILFIVLFVLAIWLSGKVGPWTGGGVRRLYLQAFLFVRRRP